jgi:hypothetical protein
MVPLDGFEVREPSHREPVLVALSLVDHGVNMPGKNFPCLQHHRLIALLQLLIDAERPLDGGRGANTFNAIYFSGVCHDDFCQSQGVDSTQGLSFVVSI